MKMWLEDTNGCGLCDTKFCSENGKNPENKFRSQTPHGTDSTVYNIQLALVLCQNESLSDEYKQSKQKGLNSTSTINAKQKLHSTIKIEFPAKTSTNSPEDQRRCALKEK